MDYISISDLLIFANHGVFEEEKRLGQKFLLDIRLGLSTQHAALHNDLESSVHYGLLSQEVERLFRSRSHDLIETCAEEVAQFILKTYPLVEEVFVRVKKPWAPVHLPLDTVCVEVSRKRHRAFLGLGSNMGDSEAFLNTAIQRIQDEHTTLLQASSLYRTKAWGRTEQPDFLNQVVEVQTSYEAMELLRKLQNIELELGRERKIHWGPRTVDIDILFFDDIKSYTKELILPHPYVEERDFVLEPMNEIAPHFIHPILNKPIRKLWKELQETSAPEFQTNREQTPPSDNTTVQ